jgi:hypothetical protein
MQFEELLSLLKSLLQVTVVVQPSEIVSYDEAARMLGVTKDYLQRHGEIPRYQPSNNRVYFRRSDLESFVFTNRMISKDDFLRKMDDLVSRRQLPLDEADADAMGEAATAQFAADVAEECKKSDFLGMDPSIKL